MPSKNKAVHHQQVVAPLHMKGRELGEDNEDDEREVEEIKRLDGKSSGVQIIGSIIKESRRRCAQLLQSKLHGRSPKWGLESSRRVVTSKEELMGRFVQHRSHQMGDSQEMQKTMVNKAVELLKSYKQLIDDFIAELETDPKFGTDEDEDKQYYDERLDCWWDEWLLDFDSIVGLMGNQQTTLRLEKGRHNNIEDSKTSVAGNVNMWNIRVNPPYER